MSLQPNRADIERYFDTMFSYCEGFIPLRSFAERGGNNQPPHNIWIENDAQAVDKALTFARWADDHGCAFYVIPGTVAAQGQASAADVKQMQTLLIDIDHGDIPAKYAHLVKHIGAPSLVVASGGMTPDGHAKLHLYWKLSEPAEGEDLQKLLHARHQIAVKAGGDTHFRSAHQPIRVAGSIYHKHEQKKAVIIRDAQPVEFHHGDVLELAEAMPAMEGIVTSLLSQNPLDFNSASDPVSSILIRKVREGGIDGITRFDALSTIIGYWLRRYHEGIISDKEAWEEIWGYNNACIIPPWPEKKLKEDTNRLWIRHCANYGQPVALPKAITTEALESYSLRHLLADHSPMPQDIIAPRILTPGGIMVFAGAPKVGKSDFLLSLFVHLAAGKDFLGFIPPRPLRIFYLQAEVQYHYLRERLQCMQLPVELIALAAENLFTTPQVKLILNEPGIQRIVAHVAKIFAELPPDIIAIDPIRNVFDGGDDGGENDNSAMLVFLQERVETLRMAVNPNAGIVLVHHTRKVSRKQFEESPFQCMSGASSLRGYYSTGMILYRPEESTGPLQLLFELRNGAGIADKIVEKVGGQWIELDPGSQRLVRKDYGERMDAERIRKREQIVRMIYARALEGEAYTATQFAEAFENQAGLGSKSTILDRINVCATKGYIKFFRDKDGLYSLPSTARSKYGFMCVEGMQLKVDNKLLLVLPDEYKHPQSGSPLPVEHPDIWVYPEEE